MSIIKKMCSNAIDLRYRKKYYYNNTFDILKDIIKEDTNKYSTRSILFKNFSYFNNYFFYNQNYNFDYFYKTKKSSISDFNYKIKKNKTKRFFKRIKNKNVIKTFFFITKNIIKNNFIKKHL